MRDITAFFSDDQLQQWGFQTEGLPKEIFSVADEREPDVLRSADAPEYACFLMDFQCKEFTSGNIAILTPYIWKNPEDEKDILYGWEDKYSNFYDHKTQNIHNDKFIVVAWKKL